MIKKITCPRCKGDGHIDLPLELKKALLYVAQANHATAKGLYKVSSGTRSSANRKLDRLYNAKLVSRQMDGREFIYSVKE